MPRFALLEHDHPMLHWDLMLERDGVLWTWRLPELPVFGVALLAERIGEHRLLYLDYEGPVSGNRGTVKRIDGGYLTWIEAGGDRIVVALAGSLYRGKLEGAREDGTLWRVVYFPA
jgi:hypothetical protein